MAMPFPAIQQLRTPPVGRPHPHPMTTTAASAAGGSYSYPEHYDAHRGSQSSLSLPHNTTTTPQIPTYARIIRIFGFIPVLFLIILIGISYYGVVFVIYTRILERGDRTLVGMACHLVMYHVLLALVLVSFGRTVWTHPGSPIEDPLWFEKRRDAEEDEEDTGRSVTVSGMPKEFSGDVRLSQFTDNTENMTPCAQPPSPLMHASLPVAPVNYHRQRRYCRKCRLAKPDRAHHCSICHRCILKMDHHCPWVNTCVGHRNYKYFVLFTVWTAVYCLYTSGTSLATAVWAFRRGRYPVMPLDANLDANLSVAYCILAGGLFGIFLAFFSGFHIHLVLKNKSTIENMDGSHLRSLSRSVDWKGGGNVFDLGRRRNWEQVFGESKWLWLLPVASSLGDGFTYPLNTERYRRLPSAMDDPAEVGENRI